MTKDRVTRSAVGRDSAVGEYLEFHRFGQVKHRTTRTAAKHTVTGPEKNAFLAALQRIDPELADLYLVGVGTLPLAPNRHHR